MDGGRRGGLGCPLHSAPPAVLQEVFGGSLLCCIGSAAWEVPVLRENIEKRACDLAVYIIENQATVRAAAKQFGISKSTVHKDVTARLTRINPALANEARKVLDVNKKERHIRGGLATREKYLHEQ